MITKFLPRFAWALTLILLLVSLFLASGLFNQDPFLLNQEINTIKFGEQFSAEHLIY